MEVRRSVSPTHWLADKHWGGGVCKMPPVPYLPGSCTRLPSVKQTHCKQVAFLHREGEGDEQVGA